MHDAFIINKGYSFPKIKNFQMHRQYSNIQLCAQCFNQAHKAFPYEPIVPSMTSVVLKTKHSRRQAHVIMKLEQENVTHNTLSHSKPNRELITK